MGASRRRLRAQTCGPTSPIPSKLYFKIGEVVDLVGVAAHVLRYWEKEIPMIRPGKTASNQRRYRRADVEIFREVCHLLHSERYTLAGARRRLAEKKLAAEGLKPNDSDVNVPSGLEADLSLGIAAEPIVYSSNRAKASLECESQVALGLESETLEKLRNGLRELLNLAGEEP